MYAQLKKKKLKLKFLRSEKKEKKSCFDDVYFIFKLRNILLKNWKFFLKILFVNLFEIRFLCTFVFLKKII